MVARVKIGSNVVAGDFPVHRLLAGDHHLGGDTVTSMNPHRNSRLPNSATSNECQLLGECRLTAGGSDHKIQAGGQTGIVDFLKRKIGHKPDHYNTLSVISVNTRSANKDGQTSFMPKQGKISEFWRRLTEARTTCVPPRSMRQEDIAKEYGMAYQSAVTKWKTGGPKGTSMPDPDIIRQMALDTNVNVNWLWAGQGDMRPLPATDAVVKEIVGAVNSLRTVESKVQVLRTAIAQQTLEDPAVAARLESATEKAAKALSTPNQTGFRRRGQKS